MARCELDSSVNNRTAWQTFNNSQYYSTVAPDNGTGNTWGYSIDANNRVALASLATVSTDPSKSGWVTQKQSWGYDAHGNVIRYYTYNYQHTVTVTSPTTTSLGVSIALSYAEVSNNMATGGLHLAWRATGSGATFPNDVALTGTLAAGTYNYSRSLTGLAANTAYDLKIYYVDKEGHQIIVESQQAQTGNAPRTPFQGVSQEYESGTITTYLTDIDKSTIKTDLKKGQSSQDELNYYDRTGRLTRLDINTSQNGSIIQSTATEIGRFIGMGIGDLIPRSGGHARQGNDPASTQGGYQGSPDGIHYDGAGNLVNPDGTPVPMGYPGAPSSYTLDPRTFVPPNVGDALTDGGSNDEAAYDAAAIGRISQAMSPGEFTINPNALRFPDLSRRSTGNMDLSSHLPCCARTAAGCIP